MLEQEKAIQSLMWGWIAGAETSDQEAPTAKTSQQNYKCPFFEAPK